MMEIQQLGLDPMPGHPPSPTPLPPHVRMWKVESPEHVSEVVSASSTSEAICVLADFQSVPVLEALVLQGFVMAPQPCAGVQAPSAKFIRPPYGEFSEVFLPPLPEQGIRCADFVLSYPTLSDIPSKLEADWAPTTREHALLPPLTEEAGRSLVATAYLGWRRGPSSVLIARSLTNEEPVAKFMVRKLVPPGVIDAGYMTFPRYRRLGVAWKCLHGLTQWLFANSSTQRIELGIKPDNVASVRTAERAGYQFEARRSQRLRNADGSYDDELSYADVKNSRDKKNENQTI